MASEPVVSLAERLRQRREELGLSQAQAARELDVARTAYRLWEMEAAKPSPDRWRLISRWLGVSVTTMLLAEELISDEEAAAGDVIALDFERRSGRSWDASAADEPGTFFAQTRRLMNQAAKSGYLTDEHADELRSVLDRIELAQAQAKTEAWEVTELRKTLLPDDQAPRKARRAIEAMAEDFATSTVEVASLLASELVTNSLRHGMKPQPGPIELVVSAGADALRVEVSEPAGDTSPEIREPYDEGGYGLTIVDALASRWGTDGVDGTRRTWFELDVVSPGSPRDDSPTSG